MGLGGTGADHGRGVLEGAFEILAALGSHGTGLGLTELACNTGLAKTTVHRLAEQLVAVGAVQRIEHCYYIGPTIARLGRCWQPDPQLRQAACGPVRALAARANTAAAAYVLNERRAHLITAAVRRGQTWLPPADLDAESIPYTAVGRVLLATNSDDGAGTAGRLRLPRDWRTILTDDPQPADGICWVAAPVWRPNGQCAAAVAALVTSPALPPGVKDSVICAARQIGQHLQ